MSSSPSFLQRALPGWEEKPKARTTEDILQDWRAPGSQGFFNWLEDVSPRILTRSNRYEVFVPTLQQSEQIQEILRVDSEGNFVHSMSLLCAARRHGKSTIFALLTLWFIASRRNFTAQLVGTTESHCRRTQFRLISKIIEHTPVLSKLLPERDRHVYEIHNSLLGSVVQMSTGTSAATSFGEKLNLIWFSDLHAAPDLGAWNALQASLLDSEGSLVFVDSNVDATGGHVHKLQEEAATDPGIFASHVSYQNFKEFERRAPKWIDRSRAKRLKRTLLPADYKRDVLGQRSDSVNALFPQEVLERCVEKYRVPVSDVRALASGRAYKVGGGLDRARSLLAGVGRGDNTVWTVVAKVASPSGEPEVYVLNQTVFRINTASAIKSQILKDHERYNLDNVILENHETADLFPWMASQKIPCELISPHDTQQNASFPELARIAREARLHYPESLKQLSSELSTFTYKYRPGAGATKYSFGHASGKYKDDCVYALNWAVFALRRSVLSMYHLGNIQCMNRSPKRRMCFIMGGNLELHCAQSCPVYSQVESYFKEYKNLLIDDALSLQEFFTTKVKLTGARISQAA